MFKLDAITRFVCAGAITLATVPASAEPTKSTSTQATSPASSSVKSGRLAVNGVDYYYEVRGRGEPLLLLHGGLGSIDMFGPVLEKLAENRRVIAVDLHGHGRTALGNRPFRLESMGDDMAAIVKRLGYPKVDVLGYSLGGGVAAPMMKDTPMYKSYAAVAPKVSDFPRLFDTLGDFMRSKYDCRLKFRSSRCRSCSSTATATCFAPST
jgi:pimeloyl-ACP methyl ester carboxylesterase